MDDRDFSKGVGLVRSNSTTLIEEGKIKEALNVLKKFVGTSNPKLKRMIIQHIARLNLLNQS